MLGYHPNSATRETKIGYLNKNDGDYVKPKKINISNVIYIYKRERYFLNMSMFLVFQYFIIQSYQKNTSQSIVSPLYTVSNDKVVKKQIWVSLDHGFFFLMSRGPCSHVQKVPQYSLACLPTSHQQISPFNIIVVKCSMFWVDWVLQYELLIFSAAVPLQIESNSGNLHHNCLVFTV